MGARRPRATTVAGFHGPTEEMGGEDILVDRPEPQAEQGLGREAERNERGVRLGGYDASDGKTIGSLMRLFRRFPKQRVLAAA